ncbi:MAG: DUF4394 domain-containing protein [Verrucomicrobiota bacterium]
MKNCLMKLRGKTQKFFVCVTGLALFSGAAMTASAAELLAGISESGKLVLFSSAAPEDAGVVKINGLPSGETILGLDTRPATGELYALGSSSRIYTINIATQQATAVGTNAFVPALSGSSFGFDFNPVVDRIRIVSDSGQNLRVHPVTGAIAGIDATLAYATNDVAFGQTPAIAGAAYINNDTNPATTTVLYDIDTKLDTLVVQSPPNLGILTTVGSLGINVSSIVGFDVAGSDGTAYAALTLVGEKRAGLYTINLATGEATLVGEIGGPKTLTSLTALGSLD